MAHVSIRPIVLLALIALVASPAFPLGGDLQMTIWAWNPECNCSPEVAGDLERALEEIAHETGIVVDLSTYPHERYRDRLVPDLSGEMPPDLLWVDVDLVEDLISTEVVIPLEEAVMEMPWLVADLPDEVLDRFSREGAVYAIPLGEDEALGRTAWALTRSAVERGRYEMALEMLSLVRDRVPVRHGADLVVTQFEVEAESLTEGEEARLVARVSNRGDEPASAASVSFMVDGELVNEPWFIHDLEPGQTSEVEMAMPLPPAGLHDFTAAADYGHLLEEKNEFNNFGNLGGWVNAQGAGTLPPSPAKLKGPFPVMGGVTQDIPMWGRSVKVAFDGTNYLVVYKRQEPLLTKGAHYRLYGTRVSQSGVVLDKSGFPITPTIGKYEHFNLDCSGTNCLVVWMKDLRGKIGAPVPDPSSVIAGARVSKSGVVLDSSPIVIEKTKCPNCPVGYSVQRYDAPDVAFTGGDYMVVYRKGIDGGCQFQESVTARLVGQNGSVKAGRWAVHTFQGQQEAVNLQRLDFNPAQKEGFLIFDTTDYSTTPYTIKVVGRWIQLQPSGINSSHLKTIAQRKPWNQWERYFFPDIAADDKGNYYAVFEGSVNTLSPYCSDIHGVKLGTGASAQMAYKGKVAGGEMERPAVAWDGKMWTAVYAHGSGCSSWVGGIRVNSAGVASSHIYDKNPAAAKVAEVDLAFGPSNGLVVFTNWKANASSPSGYVLTINANLIDKAK